MRLGTALLFAVAWPVASPHFGPAIIRDSATMPRMPASVSAGIGRTIDHMPTMEAMLGTVKQVQPSGSGRLVERLQSENLGVVVECLDSRSIPSPTLNSARESLRIRIATGVFAEMVADSALIQGQENLSLQAENRAAHGAELQHIDTPIPEPKGSAVLIGVLGFGLLVLGRRLGSGKNRNCGHLPEGGGR